MKIFYAVQATGNGHASRAVALYPYLQKFGEVDIFLSGDNFHLPLSIPVKYRSKGLSLYLNCKGSLDYWKLAKSVSPLRLRNEIQDLPIDRYDLVLNDFEFITSSACKMRNIPSIHFGHQASFVSENTPRPQQRSKIGEYVLKNYAKASHYVGLHFDKYAPFVFTPILSQEILEAKPINKDFISVYLPGLCEPELTKIFCQFPKFEFQIFSRQSANVNRVGNIIFRPICKSDFMKSIISSTGVITGGGFETPAECLHLGKRIMSIPIAGHYEQVCNAAALALMGGTCLEKFDEKFADIFYQWIESPAPPQQDYRQSIPQSLAYIEELADTLL